MIRRPRSGTDRPAPGTGRPFSGTGWRASSIVLAAVLALSACTGSPPVVTDTPPPPPTPPDTAAADSAAPADTTAPDTAATPAEPHLVMVSFDGMRHDYLDRVPTPNFQRLTDAGVRAEALIPSYPTKTFPNHYTIATGLYPGNHGLVDNAFYDPAFGAMYALGNPDAVQDGRWYGGEPLWMTAERQGVRAASFFWVGSEAEGQRPTYWKEYDGRTPDSVRVDTVLSWLSLPEEERPRVIMLYFSEVDSRAHDLGPDAPGVDSAVVAMDAVLGRLLDGIEQTPVAEAVNVIVVSDHGMAAVPEENVVFLDDYADLEGVRVVYNATQALLYFDGDETRMFEVYETIRERLQNATVHFREELPARWHYGESRRVGELVVVADRGWMVGSREGRPWDGGGMHGWDPAWSAMHGVFLAAGPNVQQGLALEAFENVHVYPFAAALLGLEPASGIDGSLEVLEAYLRAPAHAP